MGQLEKSLWGGSIQADTKINGGASHMDIWESTTQKGQNTKPESRTRKEVSEAGSEWERRKEVGNGAGKGDNDQVVVAFVGYGKDFE